MAVTSRAAARFASAMPVPVFAAAGADAWSVVQELRGVPAVRLVTSPRHATVLLVAGTVPDSHLEALQRIHDQLPRPRTVVAWRPAGAAAQIPATAGDGNLDTIVAVLRTAFADVLADPADSAADLLDDVEPNEWRGVGPFGQGGEGMMGGTPYGRPMTMTGDDRDGLALDQLDLRLGPFLDALPGGVVLDVTLQGEVLQRVDVAIDPPVSDRWRDDAAPPYETARDGLRWLAHALHIEGLDALASRAASVARGLADDENGPRAAAAARRLRRRVRATGVLQALRGVGRLVDDTRGVQDGPADAATRWRVRLDRIVAALDGDPATLEGAGHRPSLATVSRALTGLTLTDAISTIASLDLLGTSVGGQPEWVGRR